ncbi:hypothetical protein [Glutamicibacter sp. NPDC087344]|uniref:hypothetical protein n=1 Tax=Glutamicibacter sp. NPDC087344 TaxID=3363994 RepID=UPI0038050CDA
MFVDPETVQLWASSQGITGISLLPVPTDGSIIRIRNERLNQAISDSVRAANQRVARSEQVKRIIVLATDLGENSELLTPTLKLKRSKFLERANDFVDELYTPAMS